MINYTYVAFVVLSVFGKKVVILNLAKLKPLASY